MIPRTVHKKLSSPAKVLLTNLRRQHKSTTAPNEDTEAWDYNDVNDIRNHKFSVAPMMEQTTGPMRYFTRLLTKRAVLYTEMEATQTLLHTKDLDRRFDSDMRFTSPMVMQVGGFSVDEMFEVAKMAEAKGVKQININSGCPSPTVAGDGCFGAALMRQPELVAQMCKAIFDGMGVPATVKCRLGIDDWNADYNRLAAYIHHVHVHGGCSHFIIHARAAILTRKLSPDQNRNIPPLMYDYVHRLINDFPDINFSINGGLKTYTDCLRHVDSVVSDANNSHGNNNRLCVGAMVGRAFMENPLYWRFVDDVIYGHNSDNEEDNPLLRTRTEILDKYVKYCVEEEKKYGYKHCRSLVEPVSGLFHGQRNNKVFKNMLNEQLVLLKRQHKSGKAPVAEPGHAISVDKIIWKAVEECFPREVLEADLYSPALRQAFVDQLQAEGSKNSVPSLQVAADATQSIASL